MSNHQMLDNINHKDVRVITQQHPKYNDSASYARLMVTELAQAQADYPIFFRKNNETGQFEIIAMFGFDVEENLYLDDSGWHAHYLPLTIERQPFLIGFQQTTDAQGVPVESTVVHIDMDSPRISESEGEPVFLPQGGQSPYLQHISSVLATINQGHQQNQPFIDALLDLSLIEAVDLSVTLDDQSKHSLSGLYTIHNENLAQLSGSELNALHEKGYLRNVYMIIASVENLSKLIEKKNKQLKAG